MPPGISKGGRDATLGRRLMPENRDRAHPWQLLGVPATVLVVVAVLALAGGGTWSPSAWLLLLP